MGDRAADVMVRDVICVPGDMDLRDVTKLFIDRGITGAPVLDKAGNLAGVISQRDILYNNLTRDDELKLESDFYQQVRVEGQPLPRGYQIEDTNSGRVSDVMTPVVHAVSEAASLESVARLMLKKHIHRVIVKKGKRVAGIISALDLLRAVGAAGGNRRPPKAATRRARTSRSRVSRRPAARR